MQLNYMKEDNKNKVNEPPVGYGSGKKRIAFFNSFEEAAEADYEFYRNLTPLERMQLHYELSIRVFGSPQPDLSRRFSFD
jgi:hypothetical protein